MRYGMQQIKRLFSKCKYADHYRNFSKKKTMFKISDYDCIGFDLDSTIIHYEIRNLIQLEYKLITDYLVERKGYDTKCFPKLLSDQDWDFMQNGLFFDFENGNILKLNFEGKVLIASHGTRFLKSHEIEEYYPDRVWHLSKIFVEDPLITRNGPLSLRIRTLLTCFDVPVSLVFAKAVDSLDNENGGEPLERYSILDDILDAILEMYSREQLKNNAGNFYSEIKRHPEKYIKKCNPELLAWIQKLKKEKKTFLITGSNSDFVKVTTQYAFNQDLKSLFDVIVCYAKKPGFFTEDRSFYSIKNHYEDKVITSEEFVTGEIYNQGNWKELKKFLSEISGVSNPRCLYVGDNLIEDVYAPNISKSCDSLAIIAEQSSECMVNHDSNSCYKDILNSKVWGSYFTFKDDNSHELSYWAYMIKKYSKICIPDLNMIINNPLDKPLKYFVPEDDKDFSGYHPAEPIAINNFKNP